MGLQKNKEPTVNQKHSRHTKIHSSITSRSILEILKCFKKNENDTRGRSKSIAKAGGCGVCTPEIETSKVKKKGKQW